MAVEKKPRFQVKVSFIGQGEAPELQAYLFTTGGKLIGSGPVEKGAAVIDTPAEFNGRMVEVILGPRIEQGQPQPSAAGLKRMGGYATATRLLFEKPILDLKIPPYIFPNWCLCFVRGKLVKRSVLPDGTIAEQPVCNARVHICEVDRIPFVVAKIPDHLIYKLRDDLLRKVRVIPRPFPPGPGPDPGPLAVRIQTQEHSANVAASELSSLQEQSISVLATTNSITQIRRQLVDLSNLIAIYLCDLIYLWPFFSVDCLTTVEADNAGRFNTIIFHDCADQPDLYFWVEQFQDGAWHTVYKPSIGCGTYWNYVCGTEITFNLPGAIACEDPNYDIPPGVTLFVLPYAIASSPIWGIPPGATPAPDGWVRADGFINYQTNTSLGWLYDAPFGGVLNFIQDDSYFIPSAGIKYYRYSYRRVGETDWTPIATPLTRGYRIEYSDRLPTYTAYFVGPKPVGTQTNLFEFKPLTPPPQPGDPATVVAREWTSGNLSEVAASWNTLQAAPPISVDNVDDDSGDFEVKIEVFDPAGNQVMPGASTFRFLLRDSATTTRLATAAEESGGAYILRVHVDNNGVEAQLPQPSIGGVGASDDCGFLRYWPSDWVHIQFLAAHPNNHAVFGFGITRGSNGLPSASTVAPYVEVAAASAPTATTPYNKVSGSYQRDFTPPELVGSCINAAFAASLGVYGKATNGHTRLGYDASRLIAFALAQQVVDEDE